MTKQVQKQQQAQKRKADAPAEQPQGKKQAKEANNKPQQQPQQQQQGKKAAQSQQQQAKQPQAKKEQQGKKQTQAKKAPEPQPEEEEDDDDGDVDLGAFGEPDEEALAEIEKVKPAAEAITAELTAFDEQMQAEIYAIQRKFLLKKRPVLKKRDTLIAKVPHLWSTLLAEHQVFAAQLEESDLDALKNLTLIEEEQTYTAADDAKQQITGVTIWMTFTEGEDVKAGRYKKEFKFDDEEEVLVCVPAKELPFKSATFGKDHADSFFYTWFTSEGADEGVLAAQDALSSELYVDPLQLYEHISHGNPMPSDDGDMSDDDDDDDGAMAFGEDDDDEEAPELV